MNERKCALIIAPDLGFILWLGHALARAGFIALPAQTVPDAKKLAAEFQAEPDVLIIDPRLDGSEKLAASLRSSGQHTRVIAVGPAPDQASDPHAFEFWKVIPERSDRDAANDWVRAVESLFVMTV